MLFSSIIFFLGAWKIARAWNADGDADHSRPRADTDWTDTEEWRPKIEEVVHGWGIICGTCMTRQHAHSRSICNKSTLIRYRNLLRPINYSAIRSGQKYNRFSRMSAASWHHTHRKRIWHLWVFRSWVDLRVGAKWTHGWLRWSKWYGFLMLCGWFSWN